MLLPAFAACNNNSKLADNSEVDKAATPTEIWQQEVAQKRAKRNLGYAKADKPDEYTKFHQAIRTKWGQNYPAYQLGYQQKELNKLKSQNTNARVGQLDWVERGPGNVPGRTRGIIILPGDPNFNTWLAGSVAGGIWKTSDAGQSWINVTPQLPNMATTTLAMSTASDNIIYAGTGESFAGYNATNGNGIYKSTDGGNTWSGLASTINNPKFVNSNKIIVSDNNANVLVAVTSPGYWGNGERSHIMKSVDGGQSWKELYAANRDIEDIDSPDPDLTTLYASVNGFGVLKSTDGGINWTNSSNGLSASGRIELTIAPTNPNYLYACVVGNTSGAGSDLYASQDAGASWNLVIDLNNGTGVDYLGGQGWYDNTLAVNPFNENEVYVAGVNMWRVSIGDAGETAPNFLGVDEENTDGFLSFVSFGQDFFDGQLSVESNVARNVEVRFGSGISQLAHRFTVPEGSGANSDGGAGVPASQYSYRDYVSVPLEVWDLDNNRQLMVSFRDQERDGEFNLNDRANSDEQLLDNREYIYIHDIEYGTEPSAVITKNGGQEEAQMYFFWPTLTVGSTWNPTNLPESILRFKFGARQARDGEVISVADAYGRFGGPNNFSQQTNQTVVTGVHPDHHNIVMIPISEADKTFKIINANDGGVFVSNISTEPGINDGDWDFAGNGYNTTQFYGIDKKPGEDVYIGGTQDNGTWRSPNGESASANSKYLRALGGDGFEVVWNYDDPNKMMGTVYYNAIYRSINGGQSWGNASNGITDNEEGSAPFITKLANSKVRPNTVFAVGAQGVWKTDNFGTSWSLSRISSNWLVNSFTDVEVSLANPDVVWAGSGMYPNGNAKFHVSIDGGESFTVVENYSGESMGVATGVFTDPFDENTAYVLFSYAESPKILKTNDLGQTWSDVTGFEGRTTSSNGFPDVAVYSLLVMPYDQNIIWAGTEIGLVESTDGGVSWHLANNGFPNVSIWDMKVVDKQVVIGTHARGIWTVTFDQIPSLVYSPEITNVVYRPDGNLTLELNIKSEFDRIGVQSGGRSIEQTSSASRGINYLEVSIQDVVDNKLIVVGYQGDRSYSSQVFEIGNNPYPNAVDLYQADFSTSNTDFYGNGFFGRTPDGFRNRAIHTMHNYANSSNYIYQLKYPVKVASSNATIKFDEIVMVQNDGDIVVVEGSIDGINWEALVDPYNSTISNEWQGLIDANSMPTFNNFKSREINLLSTYSPNDVVLIRFRLTSNSSQNAYGWVIDNLNIQGQSVLGFEDEVLSNKLALTAYPNPVTNNDVTTIKYNLPKGGNAQIAILSVDGKLLYSKEVIGRTAGVNELKLGLNKLASGVYLVKIVSAEESRTIRIRK